MKAPRNLDICRRQIAGMIAEATADDLAALAQIHQLLSDALDSLPMAIDAARHARRQSWADVGDAFGVDRSWASRKFAPTYAARAAQSRMFAGDRVRAS